MGYEKISEISPSGKGKKGGIGPGLDISHPYAAVECLNTVVLVRHGFCIKHMNSSFPSV
jgi:hypothetical protein